MMSREEKIKEIKEVEKDPLVKISFDILRDMYKETTPKLDEDPIIYFWGREGREFMNYYLSGERFDEIVEEHLSRHDNLTKKERDNIRIGIYLGLPSPTNSKRIRRGSIRR